MFVRYGRLEDFRDSSFVTDSRYVAELKDISEDVFVFKEEPKILSEPFSQTEDFQKFRAIRGSVLVLGDEKILEMFELHKDDVFVPRSLEAALLRKGSCLIDFSFELTPITRGLVCTRLWPLNEISCHEAKLAVESADPEIWKNSEASCLLRSKLNLRLPEKGSPRRLTAAECEIWSFLKRLSDSEKENFKKITSLHLEVPSFHFDPKKSNLTIFCGMRNCGKTSLGIRVAEILKLEFYDLDEVLKKKHGSLENLLVEGNSFEERMVEFRSQEFVELQKLVKKENALIALGGGSLENEKTRQLVIDLKLTGSRVIWIRRNDVQVLQTQDEKLQYSEDVRDIFLRRHGNFRISSTDEFFSQHSMEDSVKALAKLVLT